LLFKRFAGVDSIDIEVESESPQAFIDTVRRIAITFGGINLEDIKAPECFEIERTLIEQCDIPVFHDDQHGTAIVTVAGALNALEIVSNEVEDSATSVLCAAAVGISCTVRLILAGMKRETVFMCDRDGAIPTGRTDVNEYKQAMA